MLSLVYTSASNGLRTICEQFANQMRICVDMNANLRCAICKQFAHHSPRTKSAYVWTGLQTCAAPSANSSPRTKIRRFFARTQRTGCTRCPFHAPGVLCSPQVPRKLFNRAPHANSATHKWRTRVYKALDYFRENLKKCWKKLEIL